MSNLLRIRALCVVANEHCFLVLGRHLRLDDQDVLDKLFSGS